MTLDRYRDLIPGWEEFIRAARAPEATTFRVRRGRGGGVVRRLRRRGFHIEPVADVDGFFRVTGEPFPVSKTLEHWLGDYYIQQAVTGVAAPALGARPGERILDLCAAPGGKTMHLADLMADSGLVVAADSDSNRLRALLANVYRLSHPNVLVVETDGRSFPGGPPFDRVLVDVPCSAEGNARRHGGEVRPRDPSFTAHISEIQRTLLRRALDLVRPGGVVLYVTCTFAPEENEAVVHDVLDGHSCALEPIDLDLPHAPGLTAFDGRSYADDLSLAWRVYPHHLDSGGLFLARIRRPSDRSVETSSRIGGSGRRGNGPDGPNDGGWAPVPARFPDPVVEGEGDATRADAAGEAERVHGGDRSDEVGRATRERIERGVSGLEESFGLPAGPSGLGAFGWMERGDSVWAHRCPAWPVEAWDPVGDFRVLSLGIRGLKKDPRTAFGERPTSDLLRMLGDSLERGIVELERKEVLEVLDRRPLEIAGVNRGFVAIRHRGRILGRGWVKDGVLQNEISKARSRRLLADLKTAGSEDEPSTKIETIDADETP